MVNMHGLPVREGGNGLQLTVMRWLALDWCCQTASRRAGCPAFAHPCQIQCNALPGLAGFAAAFCTCRLRTLTGVSCR
jgi:hypothetical protein